MWIREFGLDDFGCFQDAPLEDLAPGIMVIAGPQRAGKTTFMQAVRQLGYGIDRGTDLPPPADRYALRATVNHDGHDYRLEIDHLADPRVTPLNGAPDRTSRDLFGGIRRDQYHQLYTISLDELRRQPHQLDDDEDIARILLGASFGEASRLPDIIDGLDSAAWDLGRTTGKRGGPIKQAIDEINRGIGAKDEALEQLDRYEETDAHLEQVTKRMDEIRGVRSDLETERIRLDYVRSEYDSYERLLELRRSIDRDDVTALEEYPLSDLPRIDVLAEQYEARQEEQRRLHSEFETLVGQAEPGAYRERVLESRETIDRFRDHLERYRRAIAHLDDEKTAMAETRSELVARIGSLHPEWESLDDVRHLDTDALSISTVRENLDAHRTASQEVTRLEAEVETLHGQISELDDRIEMAIESATPKNTRALTTRGAITGILAIGAGGVVALGNPLLGVIVTAAILLLGGAWLLRSIQSDGAVHAGVNVEHLRAQKQQRDGELSVAEERLEAAIDRRDDASDEIDTTLESLEIPVRMGADSIEAFVDDLLKIEADIRDFDRTRSRIDSERSALREELEDVSELLDDVGAISAEIDDPIDEASTVFGAIERVVEHVEVAERVGTIENDIHTLEEELASYLLEVDGPEPGDPGFPDVVSAFVRRGEALADVAERQREATRLADSIASPIENGRLAAAFGSTTTENTDGNVTPMEAFGEIVSLYETPDSIDDRIDEIESRLDDLAEELEEKREERVHLEEELERLASDEDIHDAHQIIQRGRTQLEDRLESYAQYRIAERLLETLQDRYLERTTGELLEEASEIFARITNGTYTSVESIDEFDDLDFTATLDTDRYHSSAELSRATAEQLFLSIRLARISLADEPLPVLVDDSFANFDPGHVHRTLDVLAGLSTDHQVFLLTCHPPVIDQVAASHDASYYSLVDGRFDGPEREPVAARALLASQSPVPYPSPEIDPNA